MDLNKKYREEGWALITDQALGIDPENVESAARCVARWAYDEIERLKAVTTAAKVWRDARCAALETTSPDTIGALANAEAALSEGVRLLESASAIK